MNTTNDAVTIRHPTENDLRAVYENQARTFGDPVDAATVEAWQRRVNLEDILIAEDVADPQDPFLVGTSIIYRSGLTVPGGGSLPAAWLTMIAVASTHQGTGIWAQLSAQGLGILVDRGYPIVCGVPTQTAMYDNFGAGVASYSHTYSLDRRAAKLRDIPKRNRAREIDASEARNLLPELYERWCAATNGAVARDSAWWADHLEDRPTQRGDKSALYSTVHPDGFLTYRVIVETQHAFRPPFGSVVVEDFCPITDEAHAELLQTLLVLEMFDTIEIDVPSDDPLPLKLRDLRAARTKGTSDFLWVQINDVPEVLGVRAYSADVEIVLEVTDPLNLAGGRFLLQTRDGGGKCTPHEGPADIEIGLAELATIYMGAHGRRNSCERTASRRCVRVRYTTWMPPSARRGPPSAARSSDLAARIACAAGFFVAGRWGWAARPHPRPAVPAVAPGSAAILENVRDFVWRRNGCYCRYRGLGRPSAVSSVGRAADS